MSTIDHSGAIHGSDGRFTGHIAGESIAELSDVTTAPVIEAMPQEEYDHQVEVNRQMSNRAGSTQAAGKSWSDECQNQHVYLTLKRFCPEATQVVGHLTDKHSDDGSWYFSMRSATDANGAEIDLPRPLSYEWLPEDTAAQFASDDIDAWEGDDISIPVESLKAPDWDDEEARAARVDSLMQRLHKEGGSDLDPDEIGNAYSHDFGADVENIAAFMSREPEYSGGGQPELYAEQAYAASETSGYNVGAYVVAPDGSQMQFGTWVDDNDISDDAAAEGADQVRATMSAIDRHYNRAADNARRLGLRGRV